MTEEISLTKKDKIALQKQMYRNLKLLQDRVYIWLTNTPDSLDMTKVKYGIEAFCDIMRIIPGIGAHMPKQLKKQQRGKSVAEVKAALGQLKDDKKGEE